MRTRALILRLRFQTHFSTRRPWIILTYGHITMSSGTPLECVLLLKRLITMIILSTLCQALLTSDGILLKALINRQNYR